ncbi:tetratricopeptide repeat protein [Hyella patelloides]|uniref:tetratricopeptide repeat protein n=1 Tax=Hyella patelloides TaxID=1982969 RepID=UPI0011A18531
MSCLRINKSSTQSKFFKVKCIISTTYLYTEQEKYDQAEPLYTQALEIADRVLGSDHSKTETYRRNLENLRAQQQQTSEDDSCPN